ncbi:trigger factor [Gluconacetobacter diazotrophicus PA1 5]|uniref:Trigger factor n=1 Tax=Gluconacetobacter diazotrophicus (strain ATCC 49037 / DSM 5601 / CCUG 37298 / CIP 103539 / LMG 7603 / PAl5) TaxID=272568 RepID=TIG_GLUDA|nr:trigger factor [Gluconacetobacter diazotrophicus]A9HRV7.1 RecName: Full=Trigger factor; Short=TF; AltName: Full=PPIase [Gluconacetobacter diazotrophicus PA1 5]ACI53050.1 trigger factor [Gluconacetobacter diazotrophicus PA1 5]TWB07721.1 trigger factor [Gluconacetobacter diazotrophicus]CAP56988.1 Trigger factor (TF) [Gluconacetobacter diazotrophicus PA1 5]
MQVTETLSAGLKRGFTVTVPAGELESKRTARLKELGQSMNLPGFRPGKVPLSIVKQRYGDAVQGEVLEQAVSDATRALMDERGLRPAMQPRVDLVAGAEPGGKADLEFKVEVELLPDIAQPDLSTLSLTRLKATPDAETIDKALKDIASRQRDFETIEDVRPAAQGDVVVVDFVGKVDGVAFEGGTAQDVNVELGGAGFIPGFAEQIEGMSPGEEKVITVTFPADYSAENLAGKEATFDITAKALKRPVDVEIDDEMAKKIGFEGLEQVRELITRQVEQEYEQLSRLRIKRELLDALAEKTDFEAPQGMVEAEFAQIWQRVEADRKAGELDEEDKEKDEDTLRADYRKIAERRVKLGLLLAEIGRANAITVSQDEMLQAIRAEAMRYPGQEQQVFEFFRKNPQAAESLRGPIFENKVVDYVIELATVEDKDVTPEELAEIPPADL